MYFHHTAVLQVQMTLANMFLLHLLFVQHDCGLLQYPSSSTQLFDAAVSIPAPEQVSHHSLTAHAKHALEFDVSSRPLNSLCQSKVDSDAKSRLT